MLDTILVVVPLIAGLSWSAWTLIVASVGIGLAIEVVVYLRGQRVR